jgi:hypothetical protein
MVFIPRLDGDTLKFSFHDGTNWVDNMSIPKESSNKLDITGSVITGITWNANTFTTRTSAADNNWRNVAWAPELGLFVAIAYSGTDNRVMTSPDGINWTTRTSAVDNTWNSITWSPELGLFVAVASSGTGNRIMTSPNGITWTSRTSPVDNDWTSVSWSPKLGLFVAVAETGTSSYTSLKEPAIPLTANTTVTAVGTYIASASSEINTDNQAWEALNGGQTTSDRWLSSASYTGGTYNSTNSLGGYIGEWLKLQLPYSVPLKAIRISIAATLTRAPKDGVIIASNDNTNWNLLFTFANEEFTSLAEFKTWTINSTTEYSYYAMVINKVNGETYVDIGEIELVIPEVVNNIMTSPDGITWTTRASPTYNEWQSITWAPELESFVATGKVSDGLKLAIAPGYHGDDVDYFETANPVSSVSYVTSINDTTISAVSSYLITGNFIPDITGTWTFALTSDDGSYLWIGTDALSGYTTGNALINNGGVHAVATVSNTISLTKGTVYPIRILSGNNAVNDDIVLTVTNPDGVATTDLTKYVKTNFITSPDGINWTSVNSPNSTYYSNRNHYTADENKVWKSITWAPELKLCVAVSDTGTTYTKHPIVGLTANTTTTSFGTYIASASSEWDSSYQAYEAFNGIHTGADPGNGWLIDSDSQYRYSGGGGTYSGTSSLGGYSGEWIKLQLPYSIILKRIRIYPRHDAPNQPPNTGVILASNNGTTWSLLHSFSNEVFTADTPKYFEINATTEYSYYALVATTVQSTDTYLSIGEIELISENKTNILTSPDGMNWTTRTSVANNNWQSVTWAPELKQFVAVSSSGTGNRIMTSPDGVTWTTRANTVDNNWKSITWAPELGLLTAVSDTGTGNRVMTASVNTVTSSILKVKEMKNSIDISNITVPYDTNYNRKLTIRGDTTITGNFYSPGCIVQTIGENVHDIVSYASSAYATEITPLNVVITPKFVGSKIQLQWMINFETNQDTVLLIYRKIGTGSVTKIGYNNTIADNIWNGVAPVTYDNNDSGTLATCYINWFDSPNTLEEVTYYVYYQTSNAASARYFYLNRTVSSTDTGSAAYERMVSSKSAFEIAQ